MRMYQLKQRQALTLAEKEIMAWVRIKSWYKHFNGQVYVSFSGGKDSTVLLNLVRKVYPEVPAVFVDTGLEYPEIRDFVKTFDNVIWLKPKMNFREVLDKYGYPVLSKMTARKIYDLQNSKKESVINLRLRGSEKGMVGKLSDKWQYLKDAPFKVSNKCCDIMKKNPFKLYSKETGRFPFVGTMAEESELRKTKYLEHGCNAYDLKSPISSPLSFWLEKNIWEYIRKYNLAYSSVYDVEGINRTGCMFCMFGVHLEKGNNRFQIMSQTHPKQYDYCINKLGLGKVLDYIKVDYKNYQQTLFNNKRGVK